MASPFQIFRKHQAAMIIVFMAMLMVAFVILPPILDLMSTRQAVDALVLSCQYGDFHESDIQAMRQRRQMANGFVIRMLEMAHGQSVPRGYRPFGEATERQVVNSMLLAKKAEELGIVVTDRQVNQFLEERSQNKVSGDQLASLASHFQRSQTFVMDTLRNELLANQFANLYLAGLQAVPPSQRWEYYQRVYRSASIEAVPVPVAEFIDQVADPSETELASFFDEHKTNFQVPGSPEPGFRQPARARFQYFKADYEHFHENVEVTDEEIAAYYEEHKAEFPYSGLVIEPELPPLDAADGDPDGDVAEPSADATEEATTDGESPVEVEEDSADDADEGSADPETAAPPDNGSSSTTPRLPVRRVAYQPPVDDDTEQAPANASLTDTENGTNQDAAADDVDSLDTAIPGDDAAGNATTAGASDEGDDFHPPDFTLPDDIRGGLDPLHDPLWKVRDKIRERLSAERVGDAMSEEMDRVAKEMSRHSTRLTRWQTSRERNPDDSAPKPEFDADALATHEGITAHVTPMMSALEIRDETDLGQSFVGSDAFVNVAYNELGVYRPQRASDLAGHQYVFWKLEGAEAFIPELDQVRDDVVRAWKMIAAREHALAAAEQLREEAAMTDAPLAEVFAERPGREVIQPARFSWVTGGTTAFLESAPRLRLSEVEGIPEAGPEFMRTTFDLEPGEVGVAMNHSETVAYVIRMQEISSESIAREMFMAFNFARYYSLAQADQVQLQRRWLEELKDEAQLQWHRDPDADLIR